jgi:signal transduction histidine kinase
MVDDFRGRSTSAREAFAVRIEAERPKIPADYVSALDAMGERRRIARELHDRVGNGLSVAQRQLELLQDHGDKAPVPESMESLRAVICDLRCEAPPGGLPGGPLGSPLGSLEEALASYLEAVRADDVTPRLRVTGDETFVPQVVRDESFLIVCEAIRNALGHGAPGTVLVSVNIAPQELRAVVEDTGCGFDHATAPPSGAMGLSSMRERAALLGGSVSVLSQPGRGTRIELVVPLPACRPGPAAAPAAPAYGFEPARG